MTVQGTAARDILRRLVGDETAAQKVQALRRRCPADAPLPPRIPVGNDLSADGIRQRRRLLDERGLSTGALAGETAAGLATDLSGNIENLIGFAQLPVGVIGPLRVNGSTAHGDFYVPLATSEGALVASCQRGAYLISHSGGASAICLAEAVSRAPCFAFLDLLEAGLFLNWLLAQIDTFKAIVAAGSRHCRLTDLRISLIGKEVFLIFDYATGEAAGQNMVTLATEAICRNILAESPVKPQQWYLESNLSGDKKATMLSFLGTRGKKVVAEAIVERRLLERIVRTSPAAMVRYWELSVLGGLQSGSIGAQGHYANAMTALFIACGQDVACVSEAAIGLTRMDVTADGDLYVSVSLPNLIVGTVGGGTHLPTAQECLKMLGCQGPGSARKLAEICAATTLAGELSIIGSLTAGDFARAHAAYGRRRPAATAGKQDNQ